MSELCRDCPARTFPTVDSGPPGYDRLPADPDRRLQAWFTVTLLVAFIAFCAGCLVKNPSTQVLVAIIGVFSGLLIVIANHYFKRRR